MAREEDIADGIIKFLNNYLSLAGQSMVEFFTGDLWAKNVQGVHRELAHDLLSLTDEELATFPSGEIANEEECFYDKHRTSVVTFLTLLKKNRLRSLDNSLETQDIFSLPGNAIVAELERMCNKERPSECGQQNEERSPDNLTTVAASPKEPCADLTKLIMGKKKSHEVAFMAHVCTSLSNQTELQQVIDIGSGKGYLGQFLALHHGLNVISIDSSETNTCGAILRSKKLNKRRKGIMKHSTAQAAKATVADQVEMERAATFMKDIDHRTSTQLQQHSNGSSKECIQCSQSFKDTEAISLPGKCNKDPSVAASASLLLTTCTASSAAAVLSSSAAALSSSLLSMPSSMSSSLLSSSSFRMSDSSLETSLSSNHSSSHTSTSDKNEAPHESILSTSSLGMEVMELNKEETTCSQSDGMNYSSVLGDEMPQDDLLRAARSGLGQDEEKPAESNKGVPRSPVCVSVTGYVHEETEVEDLLRDVPEADNFDTKKPFMMVGPHTCGDLAPSMLRIFTANPSMHCLVNVGCCYHHVTEEYARADKWDRDHPGVQLGKSYGFPMSSHLRKRQFALGRCARMAACMSAERVSEGGLPEAMTRSLFFRAVLQVILKDHFTEPTRKQMIGKLAAKCKTFVDYTRRALKKLKMDDSKILDEVIQSYEVKYRPYFRHLMAYNQLRVALAPSIEAIILLDRLLYLYKEQPNIAVARLVRLFDPVTSPRCYALIAIKMTTN